MEIVWMSKSCVFGKGNQQLKEHAEAGDIRNNNLPCHKRKTHCIICKTQIQLINWQFDTGIELQWLVQNQKATKLTVWNWTKTTWDRNQCVEASSSPFYWSWKCHAATALFQRVHRNVWQGPRKGSQRLRISTKSAFVELHVKFAKRGRLNQGLFTRPTAIKNTRCDQGLSSKKGQFQLPKDFQSQTQLLGPNTIFLTQSGFSPLFTVTLSHHQKSWWRAR